MEKEKDLQRKVQAFLGDPGKVWASSNGKNFQIIACGSLNPYEGPDFKEIALLLDGKIIVGDAEFHIRTSDWKAHHHSLDANFNSVILHIALIEDCPGISDRVETLIIDKSALDEFQFELKEFDQKAEIMNMEEVQHYALIRLLRKSTVAQRTITETNPAYALETLVAEFIKRYDSRRRRPVYNTEKLNALFSSLQDSEISQFIANAPKIEPDDILDAFQRLAKIKIADEGAHLRREILLNCALPLAICLVGEDARIMLFLWYWSAPALNSYGILRRKFVNLPQNFLWQQQGMLEFLNERGARKNIIGESLKAYSFQEILSFYRYGKASIENEEEATQ